MTNILILKSGTTSPAVSARVGDYDRWFVQTLGLERCRFQVIQAYLGERLPPRVRDFDAVMMTGSPLSVTAPAPWMLAAGAYLLEAAEQRIPVLGVCFGHQLLAHMLGGEVRQSPIGRELGTIRCSLSEAGRADPLFEGVPSPFEVQATHEDEVARWPACVEILASNAHTQCQAFRAGNFVRAVQFHPEMDAAAMKAVFDARGDEANAGIRPTPSGRRILENFVRNFT